MLFSTVISNSAPLPLRLLYVLTMVFILKLRKIKRIMFHELSESKNKGFQHSHAHLVMYFPLLHYDNVAVGYVGTEY